MCTAVTLKTKDFYFGRNLDYDVSFAEEVTVTPRKYPLYFRDRGILENHYAIIGMAYVADGYPLYFDGVNERGLAMAGLNFVGNAFYGKPQKGKDNIAQFEFLPWILGQCASVREAKIRLENLNLTDTVFREDVPPAQLHWIIADRDETITVESVESGLQVYDNPVGVLTNNPPFHQQLFRLSDFMHLSADRPENHFSSKLDLKPYSRGMGAIGLPGDLSSQSRFVRAVFVRENSVSGVTEQESVSQFFHILGSVEQVRGCCRLENGGYEKTIYSSCCNADKGIYYYTTYENRQINAVHLNKTLLDDTFLTRFPLAREARICDQN